MATPLFRRCGGFTLFECAVAAALIGTFITMLLSRVGGYHVEAERVAAAQLVGAIRAALQVELVQAVAARGEAALLPLLEQNPLDLLSEKPRNYLGEFYSPELKKLPVGNWYFDRSDKSLVYLLSRQEGFSAKTSNFLKFKVKLSRLPTPADLDGRSKITNSLVFDQVFSDHEAIKN